MGMQPLSESENILGGYLIRPQHTPWSRKNVRLAFGRSVYPYRFARPRTVQPRGRKRR